MLILFARTAILYALIFLTIRLTGKRQISDLQPFDLIATLLVAELASEPAANTNVPLLYGVVPILTLFLLQRAVAYLALKSERARTAICGTPLILIRNGLLQLDAMRGARYTVNDLLEQLRSKDIFDFSDVSYAILETNGALSVLLKGEKQAPTCEALSLPPGTDKPPYVLILDGKLHPKALRQAGYEEGWLRTQLARLGDEKPDAYLFALLARDTLLVQTRGGGESRLKRLVIGGDA